MPIVDGKRRIETVHAEPQYVNPPNSKTTFKASVGGKAIVNLSVINGAVEKVEADLAVVREHFGLNISDSLKTSLHLVANAIREGRLNVG